MADQRSMKPGTPERDTRKVLMSPEMMEQFASRDLSGNLVTWDWREPDAEGFWEPNLTVHYDDNLAMLDVERLARAMSVVYPTFRGAKVLDWDDESDPAREFLMNHAAAIARE